MKLRYIYLTIIVITIIGWLLNNSVTKATREIIKENKTQISRKNIQTKEANKLVVTTNKRNYSNPKITRPESIKEEFMDSADMKKDQHTKEKKNLNNYTKEQHPIKDYESFIAIIIGKSVKVIEGKEQYEIYYTKLSSSETRIKKLTDAQEFYDQVNIYDRVRIYYKHDREGFWKSSTWRVKVIEHL